MQVIEIGVDFGREGGGRRRAPSPKTLANIQGYVRSGPETVADFKERQPARLDSSDNP